MSSLRLQELPTEILAKIFRYLDINDLCRVRKASKRFQLIIDMWEHYLLKRYGTPLVTNQVDERFLHNKCIQKLSKLEQIRINHNWIAGKYQENRFMNIKQKFIPLLHINSDTVWLSNADLICCYSRNRQTILSEKPQYILSEQYHSVVNKFQVKNGHLLCGRSDGSIVLWCLKTKRPLFHKQICRTSQIGTVDISSNIDLVVSGSRRGLFQVWSVHHNSQTKLEEYYTVDLGETIWAVSLSEENRCVAVGTTGGRNWPLLVFDIERISDNAVLGVADIGSAIFDIKWDKDTMWTCEYEPYLRHWDIRSGNCEQTLENALPIYCFDLDYHNTIMGGTLTHGRVVMWDIRMTKYVQHTYISRSRKRNGCFPVCALAFDSEHLFVATTQNLNVLNFNEDSQPTHDFCCFTKKFIYRSRWDW